MKKVLLLSLLLSGCASTIYSWEIKKAQELCEDKGGISYMFFNGNTNVVCMNGSYLSVSQK